MPCLVVVMVEGIGGVCRGGNGGDAAGAVVGGWWSMVVVVVVVVVAKLIEYHFFLYCKIPLNKLDRIGHVRRINILTWLWGFQVKVATL